MILQFRRYSDTWPIQSKLQPLQPDADEEELLEDLHATTTMIIKTTMTTMIMEALLRQLEAVVGEEQRLALEGKRGQPVEALQPEAEEEVQLDLLQDATMPTRMTMTIKLQEAADTAITAQGIRPQEPERMPVSSALVKSQLRSAQSPEKVRIPVENSSAAPNKKMIQAIASSL